MNRKNAWAAKLAWVITALTISAAVIWLFGVMIQKERQQTVGDTAIVYNADAARIDSPPPSSESSPSLDTENGHSVESTKAISSTNAESSNTIAGGAGVTMIGDSVTVGIAPYLQEKLPQMTIDGKVGRQMSQATEEINKLTAMGKLGDYVIVELGNNGPFSPEQLRSVLQSLSGVKRVLLVTTRVPEAWEDTVNTTITQVGQEFPNVQIVDWYGASAGKDRYFYNDGVHLKPAGSRYYTSLLVAALGKE
ncbi:SGNH/GDSL hydrolase family protein [Paenibacillus wenxiniae]|uniref:Acyltransferase n=1 Tax=Paenibacillus wenxiniae TaxID=1636843 RepID=A0ABW4RNZ0_9BACL